MKQKEVDAALINNMAQNLGLSPMDIFTNWVKTGEIRSITVNITYKNGDVVTADLLGKTLQQGAPCSVQVDKPSKEKNSALLSEKNNNISETKTEQGKALVLPITSFPKGKIAVKTNQLINLTLGAYVYSSGDILLKPGALRNVNMRGIVFSHTEKEITILKCIGGEITALEAIDKVKDGWRFLTFNECMRLVNNKDRFNIRFSETRRKQIDDDTLLLYQDEQGNLSFFQAKNSKVKRVFTDKNTTEGDTYALYMVKDFVRI